MMLNVLVSFHTWQVVPGPCGDDDERGPGIDFDGRDDHLEYCWAPDERLDIARA